MNSHIIYAMQEMLKYTMIAVCIIGIPTLLIGVFISIFQAATQINEVTLSFIPKLIVMFSLLFFIMPFLMNSLVEITRHYLLHLEFYLR